MRVALAFLVLILAAGGAWWWSSRLFHEESEVSIAAAITQGELGRVPTRTDGLSDVNPTSNSSASPEGADAAYDSVDDFYLFIRSNARAAFNGDPRAQLQIAKALLTCNHTPKGFDPTTLPSQEAKRLIRDIQRCERYWAEDPFTELPARGSDSRVAYGYEYWLERAVEARVPVALAISALAGINGKTGQDTEEARRVSQQRLQEAVRAKDPEVYFYVASTLAVANAGKKFDSRTAAWYLFACRQGGCVDVNPILTVPCPDGVGTECDQRAAIEYELQKILSASEYATAVELSYELQESIRREDWSALNLKIY